MNRIGSLTQTQSNAPQAFWYGWPVRVVTVSPPLLITAHVPPRPSPQSANGVICHGPSHAGNTRVLPSCSMTMSVRRSSGGMLVS